MFSLKGKVTVVTGGGSGIGAASARLFARAGGTVYILDRDFPAAHSVAADLAECGKAFAVRCDVADASDADAAIRHIIDASGRLDVLMNNAGIGHVGTILTTTAGDLQRVINVNVFGAFHLTKYALPHMIAQGNGSVINVASIGGVVGIPDRFAYCATKFAIVGMTKCLALDHAKTGVRFNAICPARVETPFVRQRISEYADPAAAYRAMTDSQPVGRMARPDEIAAAALYLASDEAAFVTGSEFVIDGAYSAG
jgi:2-keto-3-deoxy-L-fuconate dehydrogenase